MKPCQNLETKLRVAAVSSRVRVGKACLQDTVSLTGKACSCSKFCCRTTDKLALSIAADHLRLSKKRKWYNQLAARKAAS